MRLWVAVDHKHVPSNKWNSTVSCKSKWIWEHHLIWRTTATHISSLNIGQKYCVPCKRNFVVNFQMLIREDRADIFDVHDATRCVIRSNLGRSVWSCGLLMMDSGFLGHLFYEMIDWSWSYGSFRQGNVGREPSRAPPRTCSSGLDLFICLPDHANVASVLFSTKNCEI